MARGVPGFVRIGAALAGCALVAACTPEAPPTQTSTPAAPASSTVPSASPTPSATPTETEIERRQRLDFDAAEKAYRTAVAESDRIAQRGGASEPTRLLRSVAAGDYLKVQVNSLKFLKSRRWRTTGSITIVAVGPAGGWRADRLQLTACEDNSTWRMLDSRNRDVTPEGLSDYVQALTVVSVAGEWKVSALTTKEVPDVSPGNCR
jgi:hypothetical protein